MTRKQKRTAFILSSLAVLGIAAGLILYAIRDVTGTVESIPLITASILSKKLAAGLDALILDVKTGSGAFMPTLEKSTALAESLVSVANGAGTRTGALITDMNEPLASAAGNALEVRNAVDFLTGKHRDPRLLDPRSRPGAGGAPGRPRSAAPRGPSSPSSRPTGGSSRAAA